MSENDLTINFEKVVPPFFFDEFIRRSPGKDIQKVLFDPSKTLKTSQLVVHALLTFSKRPEFGAQHSPSMSSAYDTIFDFFDLLTD